MESLEALKEARPYLRSAVALVVYLRYGQMTGRPQVAELEAVPDLSAVYATADAFLDCLENDMKAADHATG